MGKKEFLLLKRKGAKSKIEDVIIRKSDNLKSIICDWVVIVEHRD